MNRSTICFLQLKALTGTLCSKCWIPSILKAKISVSRNSKRLDVNAFEPSDTLSKHTLSTDLSQGAPTTPQNNIPYFL